MRFGGMGVVWAAAIIRIPQQGTRAHHQLHSRRHESQFIRHSRYIFRAGAACSEMFGASKNYFVFQHQGHRRTNEDSDLPLHNVAE